ncbi:hypothetical protein EVA_02753 [gut metagenome]|uniref:Uncharacterized protein n=1 Tax=gut metagenome TaxID=749906 RepID=J9D8L5_9ZZZZ
MTTYSCPLVRQVYRITDSSGDVVGTCTDVTSGEDVLQLYGLAIVRMNRALCYFPCVVAPHILSVA